MSSYVITDSTSKILKNFSAISASVLLRKGTTQKTVSASKSMLAIAEFDQSWPKETGVYQLPELLSNLSAYDKPSLTFEDKQFIITGANTPSHVEYPYSDPSVIMTPPEREFPLDNPCAVFTLPAAAVAEIKKLSVINSLPSIAILVDSAAQTIVVKPQDEKNPGSRTYSYPVHSDPKNIQVMANRDEPFTIRIKQEHFMLLMDGAYTVTVGDWPYVFLKHETESISYFIVKKS